MENRFASVSKYDGVRLSPDLVPEGVSVAAWHVCASNDDLSHGAQEQLELLVRLALGVVLSKGERQCILLDDQLATLIRAAWHRPVAFSPKSGEVPRSSSSPVFQRGMRGRLRWGEGGVKHAGRKGLENTGWPPQAVAPRLGSS